MSRHLGQASQPLTLLVTFVNSFTRTPNTHAHTNERSRPPESVLNGPT